MFIDVGATGTEVSHWRFRTVNTLTTGERIAFRSTESVGGVAIDRAILSWLTSQTGGAPSEELERFCKSANEQVAFGFDATIGELNLTSEILAVILKPINAQLIEIVRTFRTADSVEFIGGASKLALLRQSVADFRPEIPVLTSLNADEAATLGSVSHEAIRSKLFYGHKIQLNKTSSSGFTVRKGAKSREMLAPGSQLTLRMISFLEPGDFTFSLLANASDFLTVSVDLQKILRGNTGRLGDDKFFVNVSFDAIPELETHGVVEHDPRGDQILVARLRDAIG
jgi:hypothetical protein